jgi:pimeloyl-ACP methyl ester carboxylesterase
MRELDVTTPDGRTLRVLDAGPEDGAPVLVHNGTPNSRLLYGHDVERAEQQGVRMISYDRPGYGGSTRLEGRSVADCAVDVRAIAAALQIERLAVWGISGGGPHALACAALLEDLVPAVGVLGSIAPWGADGLDYFEGMGELNVEDIKLAIADKAAARAKCEADREAMLAADAAGLTEQLISLLSPVDAAVMTGEIGQYIVDCVQNGLAPGADGWWDDAEAHLGPWGFELSAIRTPVLLMHGRQDRFVPFAHGQWLATQVPGVEAFLSEEDGHLTLTAHHLDRLHAWLVERL